MDNFRHEDVALLFPFGHGLSYTMFAYRNLMLDAAEYGAADVIHISVDVENTGSHAGKEVIQVYVRDVQSRLARPEKELKAFAKVALEPGETKTITFALDGEALSYYDPTEQQWVTEAGEFEVLVGNSCRDIHLKGSFHFNGEPAPELSKEPKLYVGLPLRTLLDNADGKAVLEKYLGAYLDNLAIGMALNMSPADILSKLGA